MQTHSTSCLQVAAALGQTTCANRTQGIAGLTTLQFSHTSSTLALHPWAASVHAGVCAWQLQPSLLIFMSSALALTHVIGDCWHSTNRVRQALLAARQCCSRTMCTWHISCYDNTGRCTHAGPQPLSYATQLGHADSNMLYMVLLWMLLPTSR